MSDSGSQRHSSSAASASNPPQVEHLLGLRRNASADGGGGGAGYDSDGGGEDTGVARLWRRAFSGLKLAKDKSNKKKKDSSMESEDIDPVYSLLKHAADRGTQKCQASCCSQSDRAASAAAAKCQCLCHSQQQQQQHGCGDTDCSGCGGSVVWAAKGRVASVSSSSSSSRCASKKT